MKVVLNKVYCILFYNTFQPKSKGFVQKIGFEICCKHVINHNSFPQHESCTQKKSCWHNNRLEASWVIVATVVSFTNKQQTMQLLHMRDILLRFAFWTAVMIVCERYYVTQHTCVCVRNVTMRHACTTYVYVTGTLTLRPSQYLTPKSWNFANVFESIALS